MRHCKITSSGQAFLSALWESLGGITVVAKRLGVNIQAPRNWMNRGLVPASKCPMVSKKLRLGDCQMRALNYKVISGYFGRSPSFPDIVKSYKLGSDAEKFIFSFKDW